MSAQIIPFPVAGVRARYVSGRQPVSAERTTKSYVHAYDQLIRELFELERAGLQRPDWQSHVEAVLAGTESRGMPK